LPSIPITFLSVFNYLNSWDCAWVPLQITALGARLPGAGSTTIKIQMIQTRLWTQPWPLLLFLA